MTASFGDCFSGRIQERLNRRGPFPVSEHRLASDGTVEDFGLARSRPDYEWKAPDYRDRRDWFMAFYAAIHEFLLEAFPERAPSERASLDIT